MKNWKAYVTLLVVFCLVVAMVACGEEEEIDTSEVESTSVEESVDSSAPDGETTTPKGDETTTAPADTTTAAPTTTTAAPTETATEPGEESSDPEETTTEAVTTTFPNYPSDDADPFEIVGKTTAAADEGADPQN